MPLIEGQRSRLPSVERSESHCGVLRSSSRDEASAASGQDAAMAMHHVTAASVRLCCGKIPNDRLSKHVQCMTVGVLLV